ncbi:DUF4286 family protein [Pollutimonas sp. M17]|uniref:DUF4286 family protein n=1 Tax=Pollutimonas sp. M17 TaxID=2962065 RepID=UPI0021F450F2|nr:DUF4286 family protein [Pollutimonas sp. M17]UYO94141.1 hypothetical protein OEG81_02070 [Pollutimonas sp. M17]
MSHTDKKGLLLVLMQSPPTLEDEFNAWYDTEHIPERLAVPGFETGIRYVCISGAPKYMAIYDVENTDVLSSPDYLRVSFDNASPWTKRVTSRVQVYRSAGAQVFPGNLITRRAPRILLLRFRGLPESAGSMIVAGMRSSFEKRPETLQVRVFAQEAESGIDFLGMVEASSDTSTQFDAAAFGDCIQALDLVNSYAAY